MYSGSRSACRSAITALRSISTRSHGSSRTITGREKGLLREAMRGVLPDEVLWRRKSPYPKTWNPSYLAAVSAELRTVLNDPAAPLLRIIRADALETLLASGADNPIPWYGQLMTTPQTIAWFCS